MKMTSRCEQIAFTLKYCVGIWHRTETTVKLFITYISRIDDSGVDK